MTDTTNRTLPVKYTKSKKAQLQRQREKRIHDEQLVLDAARSGASLREISRQTGISVTHVRRIYASAMDHPEDSHVAEFKKIQEDRLRRLLFATWGDAMENEPRSVRNALRILQELNKMEPGIYPSTTIDLSGTITVKDASAERLARVLARIQTQVERRSTLALESGAVEATDTAITGGSFATPPTTNGRLDYADAIEVDSIDDQPHANGSNGHDGATE